MRELFKKYQTVIRFVLLFMGTYLLMSIFYGIYLKASMDGKYQPDYITNLVARQTFTLLEEIGYRPILNLDRLGEGVAVTIEDKFTVSIVEGCNSVSIIILFISFIIAFAEKFKKTFIYILAGSVLIYLVNLIRIVILTVALYKFPEYDEMLHSVVFPGIIYSLVFLLWMGWVWMLKPEETK